MVKLTGKARYSREDVRLALQKAYGDYYTPCSRDSKPGQARIAADTEHFLSTGELPAYALSAAQ